MKKKDLTECARANRKAPTKSEQILWKLLRCKQLCNIRIRRQYVIEPFIVDFACVQHKLIVEIDGGYHENTEQIDARRQRHLEDLGWTVVRFTNEEIEEQPEAVLSSLAKAMKITMSFTKQKYKPSGKMKPR